MLRALCVAYEVKNVQHEKRREVKVGARTTVLHHTSLFLGHDPRLLGESTHELDTGRLRID